MEESISEMEDMVNENLEDEEVIPPTVEVGSSNWEL